MGSTKMVPINASCRCTPSSTPTPAPTCDVPAQLKSPSGLQHEHFTLNTQASHLEVQRRLWRDVPAQLRGSIADDHVDRGAGVLLSMDVQPLGSTLLYADCFGTDFKTRNTSRCDGVCGATAQLRAGVADFHSVYARAGAGVRRSAESAAGWQFTIVRLASDPITATQVPHLKVRRRVRCDIPAQLRAGIADDHVDGCLGAAVCIVPLTPLPVHRAGALVAVVVPVPRHVHLQVQFGSEPICNRPGREDWTGPDRRTVAAVGLRGCALMMRSACTTFAAASGTLARLF